MTFGRLNTKEHNLRSLHFVGKRFWRLYHTELVLDGLEITHEPRFLGEDIIFCDMAGNRKLVLKLRSAINRSARNLFTRDQIVETLSSTNDVGDVSVDENLGRHRT